MNTASKGVIWLIRRVCGWSMPIVVAPAIFVPDAPAQPTINSLFPLTLSDRVGDHVAYVVAATASSGTLSYAWHQAGSPAVLSTSSALILTNIQPTNGGRYYAVVTDSKGSTQSGNVTLNVLEAGTLLLYPTNLMVARIGDDAQALSGATGNTFYLDQYTTNGTYLNSIQIPDEGLGLPYGAGSSNSGSLPAGSASLLFAGSNVSPGNDALYEGFLGRAPNGLSLSFLGYCLGYPFSGSDVSAEPGGNGGNDWRGIGTVNAFGNYALVWTNSGLYSGGNHQAHSAVDIDGNATNYYTAGEAGSVNAVKYCNINFQPANGSGIASVAGTLGGTRVAQVVGNNLVFSDVGASPAGLYACSGLPQTTVTASLIIAETNLAADFAFSPDRKTVYIADNGAFGGTSAKTGGVQRWDASGSGPDGFPGYNYSYTLQMGTGSTIGARALTVDFGVTTNWGLGVTGAKIYVTTAELSSNRLLRITDTGTGSGATLLATGGSKEMLAGVRFGPTLIAPTFVTQPQSQSASLGASASFSAAVTGTGPLTLQWYFQANGAGSYVAIPGATNSSYVIGAVGTNNIGNYYLLVIDPGSLTNQSQIVSFSLPAVVPVAVNVNTESPGAAIPPDFLGWSFETGNLLTNAAGVSGYMFDSTNTQLITLFTNVGVKNLRIGGTSVDRDNGNILHYVPTNADIDALFRFAAAANVEVVFSVQLENGNAASDAAIAGYTWSNYNQYLTCLAIGNEPDSYGGGDPAITNFTSFLSKWTSFAQTITNAVPAVKFGGPDSGDTWAGEFANAEAGSPYVTEIQSHFYFAGYSGGLTIQQIIAGMLSPTLDTSSYPSHFNATAAIAKTNGFPFRATEFNSYVAPFPGTWGGNNSFASALFALDAAHWWAAHGANGVNYHTFLGKYNATVFYDAASNYIVFPMAYGEKAFDVGGHGFTMPLTLTNSAGLNLTAYAVGAGGTLYVTIINRENGNNARDAMVQIVPAGFASGTAQEMALMSISGVGATNGITLGGGVLTNNAPFNGQWTPLGHLTNGQCFVTVPNSSAAVIQIQASALIVPLTIENLGAGQVQLSWTYGTLQSALQVAGPYADLTNAVSPLVIVPTNSEQFYRVKVSQ